MKEILFTAWENMCQSRYCAKVEVKQDFLHFVKKLFQLCSQCCHDNVYLCILSLVAYVGTHVCSISIYYIHKYLLMYICSRKEQFLLECHACSSAPTCHITTTPTTHLETPSHWQVLAQFLGPQHQYWPFHKLLLRGPPVRL